MFNKESRSPDSRTSCTCALLLGQVNDTQVLALRRELGLETNQMQ